MQFDVAFLFDGLNKYKLKEGGKLVLIKYERANLYRKLIVYI